MVERERSESGGRRRKKPHTRRNPLRSERGDGLYSCGPPRSPTATFFWDAAGGLAQVEQIADELSRLLNWSQGHRDAEIRNYARLVERHRPRAAA